MSQDSMKGSYPKPWGSMYTIPQRLTVAGLATERSSTSKIMRIGGVSAMISPLTRHSFLLSSSTVFMDSIQSASTGPSKMIQCESGLPALLSEAALRTSSAAMPSAHSCVTGSKDP